MPAESMVEAYPALTLEQVHGAMAFYLGNRNEIDANLAAEQRDAELLRAQSEASQRATDCEVAACAPCESDFRLTPIWTDVSSEVCVEWRRRSTFESWQMWGWPDWKTRVLRVGAECGRALVNRDRRTVPAISPDICRALRVRD
jgi:hypothetical protein